MRTKSSLLIRVLNSHLTNQSTRPLLTLTIHMFHSKPQFIPTKANSSKLHLMRKLVKPRENSRWEATPNNQRDNPLKLVKSPLTRWTCTNKTTSFIKCPKWLSKTLRKQASHTSKRRPKLNSITNVSTRLRSSMSKQLSWTRCHSPPETWILSLECQAKTAKTLIRRRQLSLRISWWPNKSTKRPSMKRSTTNRFE